MQVAGISREPTVIGSIQIFLRAFAPVIAVLHTQMLASNVRPSTNASVILLHLWLGCPFDLDDLHGKDKAAGNTTVVAIG